MADEMLLVEDAGAVRVLTLHRPETRNAFNEALYDAVTDALREAEADDEVSVVVLTGEGHAFCAGTDVKELTARVEGDPSFVAGTHGFPGMIDAITALTKPFLCAVNGYGVGIGATVLGFADLAVMGEGARLRCPFTELGVAPEAASSLTFPLLAGRQQAAWILLSSEWISAEEALAARLVWKVVPDDEVLDATLDAAAVLAAKPLASLRESKRLIAAPTADAVAAARAREDAAFVRLLGFDTDS